MESRKPNESQLRGLSPVFTGSYDRALDAKMRFALPREFRQLLPEEVAVLYVTPGLDGALALYTPDAFHELAGRLALQSPTKRTVRNFSRLFYSQAYRCELDRQGRLRISQGLADLAGLRREITLVGVRDYIEVWDAVRWNEFCEQELEQYDNFAEQAFSGEWGSGPPEPAGEAEAGVTARPTEEGFLQASRKPK
jgi:MraZ protein